MILLLAILQNCRPASFLDAYADVIPHWGSRRKSYALEKNNVIIEICTSYITKIRCKKYFWRDTCFWNVRKCSHMNYYFDVKQYNIPRFQSSVPPNILLNFVFTMLASMDRIKPVSVIWKLQENSKNPRKIQQSEDLQYPLKMIVDT